MFWRRRFATKFSPHASKNDDSQIEKRYTITIKRLRSMMSVQSNGVYGKNFSARWTLPGGWGDEHESPRQSIEREVREESGYEVEARRLVAVKDRHLHPYTPKRLERIYKLFFLCELTGGEAGTSLETDGVDFFALDDLPPLSLGRTLADDVALLDDYRRAPEKPCYFD